VHLATHPTDFQLAVPQSTRAGSIARQTEALKRRNAEKLGR
jgi:hypothetical protein